MDSWRTRRQPLWVAVSMAVGWSLVAVLRVVVMTQQDVDVLAVVSATVPAFLAGLALGDVLIPRPKVRS